MSSNKEKRRPKPTPFFGRCSVTANPDKTNRCWLPTWTYAVVPIATVIPMGMIMVVVMIVVMVMIIIVSVMLIFSEGRYRKRQSTYYRADEREFANHLVSLCY